MLLAMFVETASLIIRSDYRSITLFYAGWKKVQKRSLFLDAIVRIRVGRLPPISTH